MKTRSCRKKEATLGQAKRNIPMAETSPTPRTLNSYMWRAPVNTTTKSKTPRIAKRLSWQGYWVSLDARPPRNKHEGTLTQKEPQQPSSGAARVGTVRRWQRRQERLTVVLDRDIRKHGTAPSIQSRAGPRIPDLVNRDYQVKLPSQSLETPKREKLPEHGHISV